MGKAIRAAAGVSCDRDQLAVLSPISSDATIAALPDELQAQWAEEWCAELAAVITMPLTATQFVRGVHYSAQTVVLDRALTPAGTDNNAPPRSNHVVGPRSIS
jgi:hypothetical protein